MKKSKKWFIRGFVGRKEKGEMMELCYNLKKNQRIFKRKAKSSKRDEKIEILILFSPFFLMF